MASKTSAPATISIQDLRKEFQDRIIAPGDPDYDKARTVFYGGIDRHPSIIIRVKDQDDVARVVNLARETGLELAVRSGGHSLTGYSVTEGGIVLDLSNMKGLEIDVPSRTAWAQTGLTAGEFTNAVGAHGLAVGFGDTGSVGIGGITLGGGVGYLVRKYGLTIDSLLAAEVVTADGHHPDLFWAIRGGGGNFGVATRFKFRLHEVPSVVGGMLILPATAETVAGFIAASEAAPEELSGIGNVMVAPPMPFLPPETHGKLVLMAFLVYAGEAEAGERALAPFRALASPLVDGLKAMTYPEIYLPEEGEYHPVAVAHTMFVEKVDPPVAQTILEHLQTSTAMMTVAQLRVLGGAMARVPVEATAFAHRNSRIMVNLAAMYQNPGEKATHEAWVADFASALQQSDSGAYVNFLGGVGEEGVRAAYPGATRQRLAEIKARYDPTNLFHLNANIVPSAG
jgi:FAD/FMN-containing dehydrogenase